MATKKVSISTNKGKAKNGRKAEKSTKDIFGFMDLPEDLAGRAREVWLAGLGALSVAEEEGSKAFKKLVKKGEKWEEEGWNLLSAAKEKIGSAKQKVESAAEEAASARGKLGTLDDRLFAAVDDAVEKGLQRLGVPSRAEVRELSGKVEKLAQQVAALAGVMEKRSGAAPEKNGERKTKAKRTVYHVVPFENGWRVKEEGLADPVSSHETKKEALDAARILAHAQEPSRLVVHKQDGTIQESTHYGD